ncbi:MAG: malto-oligosyltrehalose synthase [Halomonadaceae bacterium]|nr:MAG: malto-oligosyltrehalose synthase [Halomonadaceae bacterium]
MSARIVATYRLQLRPAFGLEHAARIVPYLARLGISHLYLSPYLQSARGSEHGYDVVDPTQVDEQLGGETARRHLCSVLAKWHMSQVLDIVPEHMAIVGDQNPWWWDVLKNGPSSRYARFFDVDWMASEERWPNKVMLPVLGDHYGRILEDRQLQLNQDNGVFTLHYHKHTFPLDCSSLGALLGGAAKEAGSELLEFIAESCNRLPRPDICNPTLAERRYRDEMVIQQLLTRLCGEDKSVAAAMDAAVERYNTDPDRLDRLIDRQNYRLAFWRTARHDLGYRRFFDINELAGLRMEDEDVFQAVHALPLAWVSQGQVEGLRVDHPDGLRDPGQYFHRLAQRCPDTWILAEKILARGESLPADWPVAGTTGYDFLNLVGGLFVDPRGEKPLTRLLEKITGETTDFPTLVLHCKEQVLRELLASELNRLTSLFITICERHRRHRDYTRDQLYRALLTVATCFPVYRTYVRSADEGVSETDRRYILQALARARSRQPEMDPELLTFLQELLLLQRPGDQETELALRFQQLTGPAMAKGMEDTAFYRYTRLLSLNEVGADPGHFAVTPAEFHRACRQARASRPHSMLATATHDTKRGEDVRARLMVLSEIPEQWGEVVLRWMDHNRRYHRQDVPDPATEYLIYQTLAGAWPIDSARMGHYMEKALREAKQHSSWTQPQGDYEAAVQDFVAGILADAAFCADLEEFLAPLETAGQSNSLAQTLLKCTAPGVPDIYQGSELWEHSLVDPDNRRPVDFELRTALLAQLPELDCEQIIARAHQGLTKLWLIHQALHLRRRCAQAFGAGGDYSPLEAVGSKADHVIAFLRGNRVLTLVPRLVISLGGDWGDTHIQIPTGRWHSPLTGETLEGGCLPIARLLSRFPVALLEREAAQS